jgi:hypothetical protein
MAEHWKSTYARTPARTASTTASPWITSGDFLVSRRVSLSACSISGGKAMRADNVLREIVNEWID